MIFKTVQIILNHMIQKYQNSLNMPIKPKLSDRDTSFERN